MFVWLILNIDDILFIETYIYASLAETHQFNSLGKYVSSSEYYWFFFVIQKPNDQTWNFRLIIYANTQIFERMNAKLVRYNASYYGEYYNLA